MNYCMRPEGRWIIGAKAAEITGIDNAVADAFGVEFLVGIEIFLEMMDRADIIVAHNIAYDIVVMRRAVFVYCEMTGQEYTDPFKGKTVCCTMMNSTELVKAPPFKRGKWKWPRLEECLWHFFGEKLEGAHDALNDVKGCAKVYYHLRDDLKVL